LEGRKLAFITFLLGSILFLPNYAIALEERLRTEKTFKPFQVFANTRKSTKSSKFLSIAGLALCSIGTALYVITNNTAEISHNDKTKILIAFILIFSALAHGHLRENACRKTEQEPNTTLISISSKSAWCYSLLSAAREIGVIFLFLFIVILAKNTIH
jgi:hypothetical protein